MSPKAHFVYELVQVRKPQRVISVIDAACQEFGASRDALLAGNRTRPYQEARRAICRKLRAGERSLPAIARLLNIHHSTVQYYLHGLTPGERASRVEGSSLTKEVRNGN